MRSIAASTQRIASLCLLVLIALLIASPAPVAAQWQQQPTGGNTRCGAWPSGSRRVPKSSQIECSALGLTYLHEFIRCFNRLVFLVQMRPRRSLFGVLARWHQ